MTTLTRQELEAMGYEVRNGHAFPRKSTNEPESGDADVSWQQMESRCRAVFEKAGCTVYSTSERRRVKRSAGVPDLLVFGPPGAPFMTFWETKAGRGKLSDAQRQFALHCQRAGIEFQSGSDYIARQWLKHLLKQYEGKR
jgi:hypothetical protein